MCIPKIKQNTKRKLVLSRMNPLMNKAMAIAMDHIPLTMAIRIVRCSSLELIK